MLSCFFDIQFNRSGAWLLPLNQGYYLVLLHLQLFLTPLSSQHLPSRCFYQHLDLSLLQMVLIRGKDKRNSIEYLLAAPSSLDRLIYVIYSLQLEVIMAQDSLKLLTLWNPQRGYDGYASTDCKQCLKGSVIPVHDQVIKLFIGVFDNLEEVLFVEVDCAVGDKDSFS